MYFKKSHTNGARNVKVEYVFFGITEFMSLGDNLTLICFIVSQ